MALVSRHYKICEAVLDTLKLDAELIDQIPGNQWKLQKKAWHRNQSWKPGGHVVPLRKSNPPHENRTLKFEMPVLVAVIFPNETDGLSGEMESRMAVSERVENIFAYTARSEAPPAMTALDALYTDENKFNYECTKITPGDAFMDGAFMQGYDACATIVTVDITCCKRDSSSMGT